jgi:hypothetical protein
MPIPFGMALLAALLCAITLAIDCAAWQGDIALPQWLSVGDVDDARALLSAILGSVSTVGSVRAPFGGFVQRIDHEQLLREAKDEAMRTLECSLSGGHNTSLRRDSPSGR